MITICGNPLAFHVSKIRYGLFNFKRGCFPCAKKGQKIIIYKTLHRKLMIGQHEPTINRGWTQVLQKC